MQVSLKNFLKHGNFGDLHPESLESAIISNLGTPDEFTRASEDENLRAIWVYGSVEFWTIPMSSKTHLDKALSSQIDDQHDRRICEGVFIEASGPMYKGPFLFPKNCAVIDWELYAGMASEAVRKYLHSNCLTFHEAYINSDPFTLIVDGSEVQLTFDDNRLHSLFIGRRSEHLAKLSTRSKIS